SCCLVPGSVDSSFVSSLRSPPYSSATGRGIDAWTSLMRVTLSSITMTSSQYRTLKLRIYSLVLTNNRSGLPLWSGVNILKRTLWWHVTGLERVAQDLRSLYRSRLTRATVYWWTAVGYPWARMHLPQRPFLRRL